MNYKQFLALYSVGAYAQDEWRATPKLRITLSLRADRNSNAVCQTNCFSRLMTTFDQLNHDPAVPYNQRIRSGLHRTFPRIQAVAWQPRFGFAYNLAGNTVMRAGIGIFSDLYSADLVDNFARNSPSVNQFTLDTSKKTNTTLLLSPTVTGSATTLVTACNGAFASNFTSGGNLASFQAAAPSGCRAPDYNSVANKVFNPTYQEWNLELQHGFGTKTALELELCR